VGAVRARVWALLRRRIAGTVLLAALIGLTGAAAFAAVAGARRGERALPAFLDRQHPPEAVVYTGPGSDMAEEAARLAALPSVRSAVRVAPLLVAGPDVEGSPRRLVALDVMDRGGEDVVGHPIVVDGRLPDPSRADEMAVDEEFVDRTGVGVGEAYPLRTYTAARSGDTDPNGPPPDGPSAEVRVVGVVRHPADLVPARLEQDTVGVDETNIYLTPAFWDRWGPDLASFFGIGVAVRLDGGRSGVDRFQADVDRLFAGAAFVDVIDPDQGVLGLPLDGVRRAIDLEARALQGFAALVALTGLVLVGQAFARQASADAADDPVLDALGMTRGQRVAAATLRAAVPAGAGALLAVAGATALSPWTPLGVARRAELHPGVHVDGVVVLVGAAALVAVVCGVAAASSWRATTAATRVPHRSPIRSSPLARLLAGARVPVACWTGLQLAVQRGRPGAAGLRRAAVVAAGTAVVVVTAAAAFVASLDALDRDPEDYGVTWDVSVGQPGSAEQANAVESRLRAEPGVAELTGFTGDGVTVAGQDVPALVVFDGPVGPRVVDGRAPRGPDEIAFAGRTMEDLGVDVGDRVDVGIESSRSLLVTGEVLLNGAGLVDDLEDGEGALLPDPAQQRLVPPADPPSSFPGAFFVRLDPKADRRAVLRRLDRDFPRTVVRPLAPTQVDNLLRVAGLPVVLAALVAVLGAGTIVHATATSVRRRRRDLAMLAGLGFVRRQVSAALGWQATAVALVALAVGVPVGVAVGRWAWRLTADALWVVSPPQVPVPAVALTVLAALLVVNAAALAAGALVRTATPAAALRAE
jgi:hypothetical protein